MFGWWYEYVDLSDPFFHELCDGFRSRATFLSIEVWSKCFTISVPTYDVCVYFLVKQIVLGNVHNVNVLTGSSTLDSGLSEFQEF